MPIRWRIDELLKEREWTGYQLAQRTGLTASAIYKLQKRRTVERVDVATLEKLAAAFGVPPLELLQHHAPKRR